MCNKNKVLEEKKTLFLIKKKRVGHLQYPGDVAGSSTTVSKFYYFLPGGVRQRSTINKHTTKLVYATVTYMETEASRSSHHITSFKKNIYINYKEKLCLFNGEKNRLT